MCAGFVVRMEPRSLPEYVLFGVLLGLGWILMRRWKHWVRCIREDMNVFGIDREGWTTAAQTPSGWQDSVIGGMETGFR